jgi:hypothetical protein
MPFGPCSRVRAIVSVRRRLLTSSAESTRGPKSFRSSTKSRMLQNRMACGETTRWRSLDVGGSAAVRSPVPEITIVAQQARSDFCNMANMSCRIRIAARAAATS